MAWYPGAVKMELQPESDSQPAIRPTQFIVHSIIAPWTAKRTYEYWRDSSALESHFGIDYEGTVGQYIGTETRADANAGANRRADGTGAVSAETASNLQGSDPWNDKQVEDLIAIGAWLHQRHGIPLRICRTHDDPGYGYHRMFSQWSTSGTNCPGDARVKQFKEVVFPGIVARATGTIPPPPEEADVALTTDEINKVAAAVKTQLLTGPDLLKAIVGTDNVLKAGDLNPNGDNPYWSWGSFVTGEYQKVARIEGKVDALAAKVDGLVTGGVDLDALAAKVVDLIADRLDGSDA